MQIEFPLRCAVAQPALLSVFCGAGGLDLGFEEAGFKVGLAFDIDSDSVDSYNHNRPGAKTGHCADVESLTLEKLDALWGGEFRPVGLIGGPPCQSFSDANPTSEENDPRHLLPFAYAKLVRSLNERSPVSFFVLENVTGLASTRHAKKLAALLESLSDAGFEVSQAVLSAENFLVPQTRERLFIVGFNRKMFDGQAWQQPDATLGKRKPRTVKSVIGKLPEPLHFSKGIEWKNIPHHRNHWCMRPKSKRFFEAGILTEGNSGNRSFKTLSWSKPSITVAYGNREVHIHPGCKRRLSVYEAMLLQSFPKKYELLGSLSSQITQVSNAVPPLLAKAVALSIKAQIPSNPGSSGELAALSLGNPMRLAQPPLALSRAA